MRIGRIYKIISTQGNDCYVGSTFNTVRDRFKEHKRGYIKWKNGKTGKCSVYNMFNDYDISNCKCILIKEYEVVDKRHLEVYETLWIKKLKSINKLEPCGGILKKEQDKQYAENNRERHRERGRIYRENNKEKIKDKYQKNKESIKIKVKLYRENNIEIVKNNKKKYYEKNKDKINEKNRNYNKELINCQICDCEITKGFYSKHRRTIKHRTNLRDQIREITEVLDNL